MVSKKELRIALRQLETQLLFSYYPLIKTVRLSAAGLYVFLVRLGFYGGGAVVWMHRAEFAGGPNVGRNFALSLLAVAFIIEVLVLHVVEQRGNGEGK